MYKRVVKNLLDIVISAILLLSLSPLLVLITVILWVHFKGDPFFIQSRPGFLEKKFNIIKFKTMNSRRGKDGALLSDKERLTSLGKIVRKLSLDELPQLINVLKGNMSLIGPRPLLFKYLPLYSEKHRRRHQVRPGITGWAQVNGRNNIAWIKKFEYDVYYVDNLSFALDIEIFWLTIYKILKSDGVNQSAERPMQPFNGNN